jgi:hypothetical protein
MALARSKGERLAKALVAMKAGGRGLIKSEVSGLLLEFEASHSLDNMLLLGELGALLSASVGTSLCYSRELGHDASSWR